MRSLRTLGLTLACLAYALVFGEMFLRVFDPQPLVPRYVTGSGDGIRANMPNVAFRQWTPEVDVTVRYNDQGMRDDRPAPPLAKAPGECRVALLGDSYFVGFESDYPHSFAYQLEQALAARGRQVRVLNFAVSGFGTAEDLIVLKRRAAAWKPDLVIMSWHASDPADNIRSDLFRLSGDGTLEPTGNSFLPGIELSDDLMGVPGYRWLIENSHLYSAVRERVGMMAKSFLAQLRGQQAAAQTDPEAFQNWGGYAAMPSLLPPRGPGQGSAELDYALIQAVQAEAEADGARFLLFDIPTRRNRMEYISAIETFLGQPAGIVTASPLDDFAMAARPDRKLYWEKGHIHWTPAGNAMAAAVAADAVVKRGWLGECGRTAG